MLDRRIEILQGEVLRQNAQTTAARHRGREPRPRDRGHVGGDERHAQAARIRDREIDGEPAADARALRHEEYVRVGQVVGGTLAKESHILTLPARPARLGRSLRAVKLVTTAVQRVNRSATTTSEAKVGGRPCQAK